MSMVLAASPWTAGFVYTTALGAIYIASQRSLTKHIKRHQPPDEHQVISERDKKVGDGASKKVKDNENENRKTTPAVEAQTPTDEPRPLSRWSKWKNILFLVAFVASTCGVGLFLGLGLPKIATPAMTDLIWMAMVGWQIILVYKEFINSVLPDPRAFQVSWNAWNAITWTESNSKFDGPAPTTRKRWFVIGLLTVATLAWVYDGNQWIIGFPIGAQVYNYVSSTMVPDRPVRSTIKWMVILQLAVAGVVLIAMGCVALYKSFWPSEPTIDKEPKAQPSQEVLMLMMMFASSLPLGISGYFIGLSLRFDYNQAIKYGGITPPTRFTDNVIIVKLPPFPKPFFKAALETLAVQLGLIVLAQCSTSVWGLTDTAQMFYVICLPANVIALRMVLLARSRGLGVEFGEYIELGSKSLKKRQEEEERQLVEEGDDSSLGLDGTKVS